MQCSTLILYNGGAYGTYLEWALTTLSRNDKVVSPLTNTGSSHLFVGNQLGTPGSGTPNWNRDVEKNKCFQFARAHPKINQNDSIKDNISVALKSFDRIIHCYPDQNSILLNINNSFSKIWKDWFKNRLNDSVFANNLYTNWNINPETPVECIPPWIIREILSYNLIPSWQSEVEWFLPDTWQHPKCKFVFISDLLYNFKKVILEIQEFCHLEFKQDVNELLEHHNQMLSLQHYLNQDSLCNNIINAILTSQPLSWDSLPMPSQSWIQWKLRELGYEMRCNELDIFPTDSVKLQELLYKA